MRNGKFFHRNVNTINYVVDGLVGGFTLVGGIPGDGKSLLVDTIAYHVAAGVPIFGQQVQSGNVMIIDSDTDYPVLRDRGVRIRAGLTGQGYRIPYEVDFQYRSGLLLENQATWSGIKAEILSLKPILLVFDHLACFHHFNENDAGQMTRVADGIEELMALENSCALVTHHLNKMEKGTFYQRLRGSGAILAKTQAAYEVRTVQKTSGKLEKIGVIPQSRKDITPTPFRVRIDESDTWLRMEYDGRYRPVDDPITDKICHDLLHQFLDFQPAPRLTVKDIVDDAEKGVSEVEVRAGFRMLEDMGCLGHDAGPHNQYIYKSRVTRCPWCQP
ncbi:MAG TPA: AAA family ATPase [Dehalococcoidia bacterium]|nr:AAA family ATPase [Dehalococcoidia bacterium]